MMAKYFPGDSPEFRIYTVDAYKIIAMSTKDGKKLAPKDVLNEADDHCAVLYYNKESKFFVLKNRYCLECSNFNSEFYCHLASQWLFQ
jgi:hypothetical protein